MCGKTRKGKNRNERIKEYLGVAPIGNMNRERERQQSCYGHVMRILLPTSAITKCLNMHISARFKQRDGPLKTLIQAARENFLDLEIIDAP